MRFVVFSRPVGDISAREPIKVGEENREVLELAADMGLRPIRVWDQGNTKHVPSHDRRGRKFAPVYSHEDE